jgi:hypothetical protein
VVDEFVVQRGGREVGVFGGGCGFSGGAFTSGGGVVCATRGGVRAAEAFEFLSGGWKGTVREIP